MVTMHDDLGFTQCACMHAVLFSMCTTAALFHIPGTVLEQEDTFFKAPNGRLKVQIIL